MYLAFLIAFIIYIVAIAVKGELKTRKLLNATVTEKTKVKGYLRTVAFGWITLLVLLTICLFASISFVDIGLRPLSFDYNVWFTATILALCTLALALLLYQAISPKYKKTVQEDFDKADKSKHGKVMEAIMPRTRKEKIAFTGSALTASIYEEILARGFLFYILQMQFPNLSIIFVVLITSALFGAAHFYQGIQGIITTTLAGILLGFLFVVTGSLIPAILLHFFINFSPVFYLKEESTDNKILP